MSAAVRTAALLCIAGAAGGCAARRTTDELRFRALDEVVLLPEGQAVPRPVDVMRVRHPDERRERDENAALVAAFVIDTTGIVERETISFVVAAPVPYIRSVCDVLEGRRFVPVTIDGRPRRALVLSGFGFSFSTSGPRQPPEPPVSRVAGDLRALPRDSLFATLRRAPHCP